MSWSDEEQERLALVLDGLRGSAAAKDAPEGLSEITAIAEHMAVIYELTTKGTWRKMSADEKKECLDRVYGCFEEKCYERSILNPSVSAKAYGNTYAQVISTVAFELTETLPYLMRGIRKPYLYVCELAAEIFGHIAMDGVDRGIKQSLYYYTHDYFREYTQLRLYEKYAADGVRYVGDTVKRAAEDESALYDFGVPVPQEAVEIHRFLAKQPQETIDEMAGVWVRGFVDSFETMRIDRTEKKSVAIRTFLGFERVTARAMELFDKEGLKPLAWLQSSLLVNRVAIQAAGICSNAVNRQAEYDHRNDAFSVLQRPLLEVCLAALTESMEEHKEVLAAHAGVAVQEIFGLPDIEFKNKRPVPVAGGRTSAYLNELRGRIIALSTKYIDPEKRTFTIIAYPVPAVGVNFNEVFRETIVCNSLPNERYKTIQQKLIDVLDRGDYVTVKGRGANETDIKVMLHKLTDPKAQTNFENCGADVNIPVGEVFTSPVLTGTEGTLHVTKVYIEGVSYKNLRLTFKDGRIAAYSCENFPTESENKNFLDETILMHHDTLPIGEFAIGTNTVAYAMGIRCNVQDKLPILIAEKTGPHFAVGDTCYSHSEDHVVYNPDGKEIIARENEVSALRSEDMSKAYMNCHTDITIPYDELDSIVVHTADGKSYDIIRGGRFVVPGTEELNRPLEELETWLKTGKTGVQ